MDSANRKLTDEQAAAIRYLVACGKLSRRQAAIEYDVSKVTIQGILSGKIYKPKVPPARFDFEIVSVRDVPDASGRSYSLFPPKRRSA